jgi:hypothetical protein
MAYVDLAKMRERVEAVVKEELGSDAQVYVEITEPPRRRVIVEVMHLDSSPSEFAEIRGAEWREN